MILLAVGINYISYKKYFRKDLSASQFSELSSQSINLIKQSVKPTNPVTITVFVGSAQDAQNYVVPLILDDVNRLLDAYKFTGEGKITVERVDPYTDEQRAKDIADKFKFTITETCLIVQLGERSKILRFSELAELDSSGSMMDQIPKVKEFKAEAKISEAIRALSTDKKEKIYYTNSHGELSWTTGEQDVFGLSILADRIRSQNLDLAPLNLLETSKIPDDAAMVLIVGPQEKFLDEHVHALQEYLQNNGKLMLMLQPLKDTGLETLLSPYGVTFQNDLVMQMGMVLLPSGGLGQKGTANTVVNHFGSHPAIRWLQDLGTFMKLGRARSLKIDPANPQDSSAAQVVKLAMTPAEAWGETNLVKNSDGTFTAELNKLQDHLGPLTIVASIDTGAVQGGQTKTEGTRVIAVGAADFLANRNLTTTSVDFMLNCIHWMLGQEESLGISPKTPKSFNLTITNSQAQWVTSLILTVPLLLLIAGALVWWSRRK